MRRMTARRGGRIADERRLTFPAPAWSFCRRRRTQGVEDALGFDGRSVSRPELEESSSKRSLQLQKTFLVSYGAKRARVTRAVASAVGRSDGWTCDHT